MGFRSQRIVSRIIDGYDGRGLGIARGTGKGEIGIAAAPLENNQLIVDAAPPAIRAAVVKTPVAMDERPAYQAIVTFCAQCSVSRVQHSDEVRQFPLQA